jgi:hypothetical protein
MNWTRWILALAVIALSGCTATHLAYVYNCNAGIDLGASPNNGNVKLSIGYDRQTFAIVPRKQAATTQEADAMSAVAVSRVELSGLGVAKFGHAVATGTPAVQIATDPNSFEDLVNKIFNESTAPAQGGSQ